MIKAITSPEVDVLLLLEGTYPYVRGGVSSWVHHLIHGFPERRFGIIFLGSSPDDYDGRKYEFPDNLVHYEEHFLYATGGASVQRSHAMNVNIENIQRVRETHAQFRMEGGHGLPLDIKNLHDNLGVTHAQFLQSREVWDLFLESYQNIQDKPAFIDYFWTLRSMHSPFWLLTGIVETAPAAKIFHSASTGYAGFLGALLANRQQGRFIVSEHGIYTKERRIDLMLAQWIKDDANFLEKGSGKISRIRELWIHFFEILARVAYQQANHITGLFTGVRQLQIKDQAPANKIVTIPNGIAVSVFAPARHQYTDTGDVIALIGRVVPIKDIKTFIRAVKILSVDNPDICAWIVGPEEENPDYVQECRLLLAHLHLEQHVRFLGYQSTVDILGKIRLSVLSSISEGVPLTMLESFAAGVPAVTTDVGACSELIYGKSPEDRELGDAGKVVAIANPAALAVAIQDVLYQPITWEAMSRCAVHRVERYYQEEHMLAAYRTLYVQNAEEEIWQE